jgi:L-lactate utilization protein LutB
MAMDASADPVVRSSDERIERVAQTLRANNIEAIVVDTGAEARHLIVELVPEGAEVHTAKVKTLEDIGPVAELQESGALRCPPTALLRRAGNGEKVSTTAVPAAERDGTAW